MHQATELASRYFTAWQARDEQALAEVQARIADDHDVITWFGLHTTAAAPAPTANWSHVENGQITRIRVAFDPRGIVGATS